ncbi:MAG: T9SS type A sorting domain-containing protein [Saprospiraceae bacterium]|nr:T9SS type A sorting domain-containing protein [Saprospiraceae bacterium]
MYFEHSYYNISFSSLNTQGVVVDKNGYFIGRVYHQIDNVFHKNLTEIIKSRIYNLQDYKNFLPTTKQLNCSMIFTVDSPFEPVQEGRSVNKVRFYSDLNPEFSKIGIFPNPTTNIVNFNLGTELIDKNASVTVLDTEGRLVNNFLLQEQSQGVIDLSTYSSGIYYILFENGTNIERHKVVKI